jgi:hypothetical protein
MPEPTSTTATSLTAGTITGLIGAFFNVIGVNWATVFWGMCGACFGQPGGAPAGRLRSIMTFPLSALASAKAGVAASAIWFSGDHSLAGAIAFIAGVVLHPTLAALAKAAPDIVGIIPDWVRRYTGGPKGDDK